MEPNQTESNPKGQSQIAGAILIVGILIAGAILLKGNTTTRNVPNGQNNNNQADTADLSKNVKPVSGSDHILGNANAKIVIVEYSDTECPFCKMFHNTMHQIVDENQGEVAWVYRHFPIESLHPKAFHEAEALECAWEQGGNDAFWKYTDQVYTRTQSNNKLEVTELPKIASDIGLDLVKFNTCLASGKYADKINSQIEEAQSAGARGTPSSFILVNGKVVDEIPGAQSKTSIQTKLDALK